MGTWDGLASKPGGSSNTPSCFMLQKMCLALAVWATCGSRATLPLPWGPEQLNNYAKNNDPSTTITTPLLFAVSGPEELNMDFSMQKTMTPPPPTPHHHNHFLECWGPEKLNMDFLCKKQWPHPPPPPSPPPPHPHTPLLFGVFWGPEELMGFSLQRNNDPPPPPPLPPSFSLAAPSNSSNFSVTPPNTTSCSFNKQTMWCMFIYRI